MLRDDLYWLALTVYQEARGEPFMGKLAVAWVIVTRSRGSGIRFSISDTVLRKLQFSCWNTDSPTRQSVDVVDSDPTWQECYSAATAAYFGHLPDPTLGAQFYLNKTVLPKLPSWYDPAKVTVTIGHHEFLRLEGG